MLLPPVVKTPHFCPGKWPGLLDGRTLPLSHSWELSQSKHMYADACVCKEACYIYLHEQDSKHWGKDVFCVCLLLVNQVGNRGAESW